MNKIDELVSKFKKEENENQEALDKFIKAQVDFCLVESHRQLIEAGFDELAKFERYEIKTWNKGMVQYLTWKVDMGDYGPVTVHAAMSGIDIRTLSTRDIGNAIDLTVTIKLMGPFSKRDQGSSLDCPSALGAFFAEAKEYQRGLADQRRVEADQARNSRIQTIKNNFDRCRWEHDAWTYKIREDALQAATEYAELTGNGDDREKLMAFWDFEYSQYAAGHRQRELEQFRIKTNMANFEVIYRLRWQESLVIAKKNMQVLKDLQGRLDGQPYLVQDIQWAKVACDPEGMTDIVTECETILVEDGVYPAPNMYLKVLSTNNIIERAFIHLVSYDKPRLTTPSESKHAFVTLSPVHSSGMGEKLYIRPDHDRDHVLSFWRQAAEPLPKLPEPEDFGLNDSHVSRIISNIMLDVDSDYIPF